MEFQFIEWICIRGYHLDMKRTLLALFLILLLLVPMFASAAEDDILDEEDEFLKEILISDISVTYGDEAFRERILERTKGQRDPIGLVLTGGSARACAHIGVLRYLDEQGIEPDFIVSNSMGSIIGMLYAAGITPDQIEKVMLSGDISSYFSLTLPSHGGFLDASGFRALIDSCVGKDYRLEDTNIPCMVVCDDLVSKREIRITEGDFTDVLIGSFALPVYFPPLKYNGHLLVDGGVISLAPIAAAYDYTDTVVLSTTFYDPVDMNLINPVSILNVSFDIGKRQNASAALKQHADDMIWIRCAVENYSFMAFGKCAEMAEIGYQSTAEYADQLSKLYKNENPVNRDNPELSKRLDDLALNLKYYGRIKASKLSSMLGFNFIGLDNTNSNYYLKNSMVMGLEYKHIIGNFDMSVIGGFGADTQNLSKSDSFLSAGVQISYYPIARMRLKLESFVDMLRQDAGFNPLLYARESGDCIVIDNEDVQVGVHEIVEYSHDFSDRLGKGLVTSLYVQSAFQQDAGSYGFDLGYQTTSVSLGMKDLRHYGQVTLFGDYDFNQHLFLDVSSRFRINLDGKGRVPLFINDGFVSTYINYGASAIYQESSLFNLVNNITFGYRFLANPTFGEFLILEKPVVGIFASNLVTRETVGYTLGFQADTTASLIGLIKLPVSFKIGCEFEKNKVLGPTASIIFSNTL